MKLRACCACQQHLTAGKGVLGVASPKRSPAPLNQDSKHAHPGPLDRTPAREIQLGEALRRTLVAVVGLSIQRVPQLKQHSGEKALSAGGYIEIRRNVQLRTALVDDLFVDAISIALERAGHLGFRSVFSGRGPISSNRVFASPFLAPANGGRRCQSGHRSIALQIRRVREAAQVIRQQRG